MEQQEHIFQKGQRVRLKDGVDNTYRWATVGSEGIVRDVTKDDLGYPLAFIEWDKDHWTYNGEEDEWAFQTHFVPVGDPPMNEQDKLKNLSPEDAAKLFDVLRGLGLVPDESKDVDKAPEDTRAAGYAHVRDQAAEILLGENEGFILVTINRTEVEGHPVLVPAILSHALTDEAILCLEGQLGMLVATSYQNAIDRELARLQEKSGES